MSLLNTRLAELGRHIGKSVTVHAWVTHLRSSGKIAFAVLRDGSGVAQAVIVKTQVTPEVWAEAVRKTFAGNIVVGRDLLELPL